MKPLARKRLPRAKQRAVLSPSRERAIGFPVVGVGASAGGLDAFLELLRQLPGDTGMAFVLVQHLAPDHASVLSQLLTPATSMPIRNVTDGVRLRPNQVYVIPPGRQMSIAGGALRLRPRSGRAPLVIDRFFQALAENLRERAIGVILSGTANDGTLGLEAIKAAGGITFAQDASARFDSMPRSAVAAGCVDFELPPAAIAAELTRMARHPLVTGSVVPGLRRPLATQPVPREPGATAGESRLDRGFERVLALLRRHSGVDFGVYKQATLVRRVARRMVLGRQETTEAYADWLEGNAPELDALLSEMLISVTSFFRNADAFGVLQRKVFRKLLRAETADPVRVWVLGCSTGQEPYSLAMAYAEEAQRVPHPRKLQVFATDLKEELLCKARAGLYAPNLVRDLSPERLRRFFTKEEGGYRVAKALRDTVVFARQNALNDPPFSRLDVISCRNVLIYVDAEMQKRILPLFHFSLNPGGVLFLGASESVGGYTDLFGALDARRRIFSRNPARTVIRGLPLRLEWRPADRGTRLPITAVAGLAPVETRARREADRLAASHFAPPGVVVDAADQILQFRGATHEFLNPPPGRPSFALFEMLQEGLMLPVRSALGQARKRNKSVTRLCRRLNANGQPGRFRIHVVPLLQGEDRCFLVMFETPAVRRSSAVLGESLSPARTVAGRRDRELLAENRELRERLRQTREAAQSATEELQSSNEEVTSANEELQSINEEMETSKEELESTNEELTTVNEELAHRNGELSQLNADLRNFLASINTPVVFVDAQLVIRRLTPQAAQPFNVQVADIGRTLGSIRHQLSIRPGRATPGQPLGVDLEKLSREVIATGVGRDCEVRDRDGCWFGLRIRPYLSADGHIDGAVLVLVDIDALKRSEATAREARDFAEAAIRTLRDPFVVLHADLRVNTANDAFYHLFGTTAAETAGRPLTEIGNPCWSDPRLHELLAGVLKEHRPFNDLELDVEVPRLGKRRLLLNGRRLRLNSAGPELILLAGEDLTNRSDASTSLAGEGAPGRATIAWDGKGLITAWDDAARAIFGYASAEAVGRPLAMLVPADKLDEARDFEERLRRGEHPVRLETTRLRADGTTVGVVLTALPGGAEAGPRGGGSATVQPSAESHAVAERLRENRDQLARELAATQQLQVVSSLLIRGERAEVLHENIVDAGIAILRADGGSLELCDDPARAVRVLARRGFPGPAVALPAFPAPVADTDWRESAATGRRVVLPDIASDPERASAYDSVGAGAMQATPLLSRDGRLLGTFSTYWLKPQQPAEGALRLFDILARQAADLIERQLAAEALQQSEGQYRALFAAIDEGFAVIEVQFAANDQAVDYRFVEVNPSFAVQTGMRGAAGRWIREIDPHHEPHWFEIFGRVARSGEPVRFVNEASGLARWLDVYAFRPQGLAAGRVALLLTDVTARRGISRDLERIRDEAIAASRAKDDFLAALSHELRTPLTPALLLAGDAAANAALPDAVRKDFESIRSSITLEARLIDDLLDLTRVARGKLKLELGICNLNDVLGDALAVVRAHLEEKDLVLARKPTPAGMFVYGDAVRLQQVLWNVLRNAIHFTPHGGRISVEMSVDTGKTEGSIVVSDTGVGLHQKDIERIFDTFAQGEAASAGAARRTGGLGLGLAISRALVEAHGGSIRASSPGPGCGSSFHITLPLVEEARRPELPAPAVSAPPGLPPPTVPARRLQILVVDDHAATCEAFKRLLERRGHGVASAGSVKEALLVIERTPVEVIVSDIGLPDGDGYELMQRVREKHPATIGIAASGFGTEADVSRSFAAGFRAHLTKPIAISQLEEVISQHTR